MLVLSRRESERIKLGDSIVVTVVKVAGDRVRLGIEAPADILVLRGELERRPIESPLPVARYPHRGAAGRRNKLSACKGRPKAYWLCPSEVPNGRQSLRPEAAPPRSGRYSRTDRWRCHKGCPRITRSAKNVDLCTRTGGCIGRRRTRLFPRA